MNLETKHFLIVMLLSDYCQFRKHFNPFQELACWSIWICWDLVCVILHFSLHTHYTTTSWIWLGCKWLRNLGNTWKKMC